MQNASRLKILVFFFFIFSGAHGLSSQELYKTNNANIKFTSDAPLELIKAESNNLQGVLNIETRSFAFKVFMKSFNGFNSPLQRIHFQENYIETNIYPEAIFKGAIIEDIQLNESQKVRARGTLEVHGVKREVLIDVQLKSQAENIAFESNFEVKLDHYNIAIPNIVKQKIAESIFINVSGDLERVSN